MTTPDPLRGSRLWTMLRDTRVVDQRDTEAGDEVPSVVSVATSSVDGVPTVYSKQDGPLTAALGFRVGQADETLVTRGLTHLLEHVALADAELPPHAYNGGVGMSSTWFRVVGEPEEVSRHLAHLCETLRELPTVHVDRERSVLKAESAGLTRSPLHSVRWGPQNYGLASFPELGLDALTHVDLASWSRRFFVRGNATLWLSAPPPAGLRVPLRDGPSVSVPDPIVQIVRPPVHIEVQQQHVAFSLLLPHSVAGVGFASLLAQRLERRLRRELGLVYSVDWQAAQVSGTSTYVTYKCAGLVERAEELAQETCAVLADAAIGFREEELATVVHQARLSLANRELAASATLQATAQTQLLGGVPGFTPADLPSALTRLPPAMLHEVAAAALKTLVLAVPLSTPVPATLAASLSEYSQAVLRGPSIRASAKHPEYARIRGLTLSSDGFSLVYNEGQAVTIRYDEIAAALPYADGSVTLLSSGGLALHLMSEQWYEFSRVQSLINENVPASLQLPAGERYFPGNESTSSRRILLTQIVKSLAVLVALTLAVAILIVAYA